MTARRYATLTLEHGGDEKDAALVGAAIVAAEAAEPCQREGDDVRLVFHYDRPAAALLPVVDELLDLARPWWVISIGTSAA